MGDSATASSETDASASAEAPTDSPETSIASRLGRRFDAWGAPEGVLAVLVIVWSAEFIRLPMLRYDRFGTFGFDLGIYDQGTWLLSRGKDPFVTIRGLELFGHHANVFLLLLVPFYWIAELLPPTREPARRLGLVSISQMLNALVWAVDHPPDDVQILDVPRIRELALAS